MKDVAKKRLQMNMRTNHYMIQLTMRKVLLAYAALMFLAACNMKPTTETSTDTKSDNTGIPFEIAKNYFFKNDQEIPANPKITTAEEFGKLFGMAAVMGKDGQPTEIDFAKKFVIAIVLPVTNLATEITPVRLEEQGDTLFYYYDAKVGKAQSSSAQPISLITLDKKYADKTVVMINEQVTDYYSAVDRYLTEQIAGHYAQGEYCVPVSEFVAADDEDTTDIRIWGDFWVYNYKQVGDTLKCVSGGSHPGLIHVCQKGEHFYVYQFDQVEDGSTFLSSAKRIFGEYYETFRINHSNPDEREINRAALLETFVRDHGLSATKYQDYGWPAKDLEITGE